MDIRLHMPHMPAHVVVQASIAEAGFMTGLERNSDVAQLAAFAPLLTNVNGTTPQDICPTSMIVFDNHRCACHACLVFMEQGCAWEL